MIGTALRILAFLSLGAAVGHAGSPAALSLQDAIAMALERNPSFLGLKSGADLAELDLENARSIFATRFSSSLNSSDRSGAELGSYYEARVTRLMQSGSSVGLGYSNSQYGNESLSELRLSYTLPFFDNPARHGLLAVDRAQLEVMRRERLLLIGAEELAVQVTGAYYDTVLALQRRGIAGSSANVARSIAGVTRVRRETGLSSDFDLRRSELRVTEAAQQERLAALGVARSRDRLLAVVGADPADDYVIVDELPEVDPSQVDTDLSTEDVERLALEHRGELQGIRQELVLLEKHSRGLQGAMPPVEISLQMSLVDEGAGFGDSLSLSDPRFGVGFNMALDRVGSRQREQRRWEIERQSLRHTLRAVESQVRANATEAALVREESRGAWQIVHARLGIANEQFRMVDLRHRAGTSTTEEALEAELQLAEARLGELESRIGYLMAVHRVDLLVGRLVLP
jgi:outer membrane protein TolC